MRYWYWDHMIAENDEEGNGWVCKSLPVSRALAREFEEREEGYLNHPERYGEVVVKLMRLQKGERLEVGWIEAEEVTATGYWLAL